jgi:hypothetical protein
MNQSKAVQQVQAGVPVLYISPEGDYPALQRVRQSMFNALPANPASQLLIPPGSHLQAPRFDTRHCRLAGPHGTD